MPTLANSKRRINKATHVSLRADESKGEGVLKAEIKRPFEKLNFLRLLRPDPVTLSRLASNSSERNGADSSALADVIVALAEQASKVDNLRLAASVVDVPPEALVQFGHAVAASRRMLSQELHSELGRIRQEYDEHLGRAAPPSASEAPRWSSGLVEGAGLGTFGFSGAGGSFARTRNQGFARVTHLATGEAVRAGERGSRYVISPDGVRDEHSVTSERPPFTTRDAFHWALEHGKEKAVELEALRRSISESGALRGRDELSSAENLPDWLDSLADEADEAVDGFIEQFEIEPIGRLHLERLEMTPVGVQRGELVYSIPLTPHESVNISHKEWSLRSEEFESIVQDVIEDFSEQGVTEKKDLSQSTESQSRHSAAFNLSGTYTGYGASVTVGYNQSSEDQQAQKESRQQSCALTRKASSRVKQEHKQSFSVTSVVGSEEQSVRTITNTSSQPTRVDYYQLMRKWQVDLYRYGLRMTYDIVIPSPGFDLLEKLDELRQLDALIDAPFSFDLLQSEITRDNWMQLAAHYRGRVESPGIDPKPLRLPPHMIERVDAGAPGRMESISFEVDEDYIISSGSFHAHFGTYGGDDNYFGIVGIQSTRSATTDNVYSDLSELVGTSGNLAIVYSARNISHGTILIEFELSLTPEGFERWQQRTWNALRDAAEDGYQADRQIRIQRRERLVEEMQRWDALTLRRMEREEIMKGVVRWLFGPSFSFVPGEIESLFVEEDVTLPNVLPPLRRLTPTEGGWERVMRFGEVIKFLHQAIEWENVLYFTYPYFWDSPDNWKFKRWLQHVDPVHRDFLRAGSARVVLTIRQGYETDFAKFVETGGLGDNHPYLTIAEEIQNYARTNYAGIPPANPEQDEDEAAVDDAERGILIGRWYEYTPSSALDVSIDTPISELA